MSAADVIEATARARTVGRLEPDGRPSPPANDFDADVGADDVVQVARTPFKVLNISNLGAATSQQEWFWGLYVPAGHLTHLGSHGGAGKSTIGLMLAVCAAVGRDCLGQPTKQASVLFFSAEDPEDLVLRRLHRICVGLDIDIDSLRDRLHVLDATEYDPVLFCERRLDGTRAGVTTATYDALTNYVEGHGIELVIVDNASDTFDADEINRPMVRAFVRSLVQIVRSHRGAVVLLAHVDKGTSRAQVGGTQAEAYSGSTAWHNSARSRLFLREKGDGKLELLHQKSNLGPKQPTMALEWPPDGLPQVIKAAGPAVQGYLDDEDARALLTLILEFYGRGEWVAPSQQSRHHAVKLLQGEKGYPDRKPADVFRLLRDAERAGFLRREEYRTADRKPHERWALTDVGAARIGASAQSAPCAPSGDALDTPADGAKAPRQVRQVRQGGVGGKSAPKAGGADGAKGAKR